MSGHSHFKTIKRQKELSDKKRGQIFSKIARVISVAAREGGDIETNPKLRLAVEQAKGFNVPKENIEKAIQRGTGELKGTTLEEVTFEAYGPGKIAIIVEGITDNKNRVLNEVKKILSQHESKLADSGSVRWMFERKGCIMANLEMQTDDLKNKEKLGLMAIEAGAEDIYWHDEILDIYTNPGDLEKVKKNLEERGVKIESISLDWVANNFVSVDEKRRETIEKLFLALDEQDDVQEIYSNIKLP